MAVTLNYTSKGLIDAVQRQLVQQKKEGKITGDISYKNITNRNFWKTLREINNKHDKKNKIYHQKSYSYDDRGKPVDWTKTVVVYGKAELSDDEWEQLLNSMGLQLTKAEAKEQIAPAEVKPEEPTPVEENKEEFAMPIATMATLMTALEDAGYENSVSASELIQTKLNCKVTLTPDSELKIYNADGKELTQKDENGKTIFSEELRQSLDAQLLKDAAQKVAADTNAETVTNTETEANPEADDENCTEEDE